jgi:peptide chain release factor 3
VQARGVPIFTFMNKCDRPTREPLDLIDELEKVLGIGAFPVNWPLGSGPTFKGVYDRLSSKVHLFERTGRGRIEAPVQVGLDDPRCSQAGIAGVRRALEEIRCSTARGDVRPRAACSRGEVTPVFFGSAMNNFGVQLLLDGFLSYSSPGHAAHSATEMIQPDDPRFSGFVFKIQANMDPRHRDRIAFVRVVSGKFERDMFVIHAQSGKRVRLGNAQKLFGNQRETVEEARAGDVVGIVGQRPLRHRRHADRRPHHRLRRDPRVHARVLRVPAQPAAGQLQALQPGPGATAGEGVARKFEPVGGTQKIALLAAVGPLQFEVLVYRLQNEYGAESRLEPSPFTLARWWRFKDGQTPTIADVNSITLPEAPDGARLVFDDKGRAMVLCTDQWPLRFFGDRNPNIEVSPVPFDKPASIAAATPAR